MGIISAIRNTKLPDFKELIAIPKKISVEAKNQKINTINIRYWDRHFKTPKKIIGTISNDTSIPLVYFETPSKQAGIIFEDTVYHDEEGQRWIEFCEDYPFSICRDSELAQYLGIQYYNDFGSGKIEEKKEEKIKYSIPMMLSKIPREVIRIETKERMRVNTTSAYVGSKIEITKHMLRQMGNIIMLERVGKKDNSFIITGVLLGGSIGILIGIFLSFAFLVK